MTLLLRARAGRRPTLHMPTRLRATRAFEDELKRSRTIVLLATTIRDDRAASCNDRGRSCYVRHNDRGRSCYEWDERSTSQHPWMVEVDGRKDRARLQFHFHPTLLYSAVHLSSLPITLCDLQESGMPFDRRHAK